MKNVEENTTEIRYCNKNQWDDAIDWKGLIWCTREFVMFVNAHHFDDGNEDEAAEREK